MQAIPKGKRGKASTQLRRHARRGSPASRLLRSDGAHVCSRSTHEDYFSCHGGMKRARELDRGVAARYDAPRFAGLDNARIKCLALLRRRGVWHKVRVLEGELISWLDPHGARSERHGLDGDDVILRRLFREAPAFAEKSKAHHAPAHQNDDVTPHVWPFSIWLEDASHDPGERQTPAVP